MLSVKDGFLYMDVISFVGVLRIVMSKKCMWLSDSGYAVNFMFGWSILKSSCMCFMSVWREIITLSYGLYNNLYLL